MFSIDKIISSILEEEKKILFLNELTNLLKLKLYLTLLSSSTKKDIKKSFPVWGNNFFFRVSFSI